MKKLIITIYVGSISTLLISCKAVKPGQVLMDVSKRPAYSNAGYNNQNSGQDSSYTYNDSGYSNSQTPYYGYQYSNNSSGGGYTNNSSDYNNSSSGNSSGSYNNSSSYSGSGSDYYGSNNNSSGSSSYSSGGSNSYVVQKGDNLYRISKKYGTTVDALKRANGLSSDLIHTGQSLIIP